MQFKALEIIKCMCMYVTIRVKQYYFKLKEKTQITERYLNDITDIVIMLLITFYVMFISFHVTWKKERKSKKIIA